MTIQRTANAPIAYNGQLAEYATDSTYQEKFITRTANTPVQYATPLVTLTSTGTATAGLQQYTSP